MKTIIYEHSGFPARWNGGSHHRMMETVARWRADKGMTTVVVVDDKRVGYDAAGKFYKAPDGGWLTFLRFTRDRDAVMFKLGYVGVDDEVMGD